MSGGPALLLGLTNVVKELHLLLLDNSVFGFESFKLINEEVDLFSITADSSEAIVFKLLLIDQNTIVVLIEEPELLLKSKVVSLSGSQFVHLSLELGNEVVNMARDLLDLDDLSVDWGSHNMGRCWVSVEMAACIHWRSRPGSLDHLLSRSDGSSMSGVMMVESSVLLSIGADRMVIGISLKGQ